MCPCLDRVRVSAIVTVSVSVFLLMSVTVSISVRDRGYVSVRDRVRVHVRGRVCVRDHIRYLVRFRCRSSHVQCPCLCPWPRGRDHIFERVTVCVAACTFSVAGSMHDHVGVRFSVNLRFRVRDHDSFCVRACVVPVSPDSWSCPLSFLRLCWWSCQFP